jgi:nitrite reductase (NADH) large subunit
MADGESLAFSKLVFATGSQPIRPALPGMALPGVITFRDINDIWTIWHRAGSGDRVVVIGGGLLGLEAAYGLAKAGARVTVLHLMDRLMERQLDAQAARMLQRAVEAMGIEVILNADTAEISGTSRVEGVTLKDGRTIEADAVVVAIGIRPSADLARDAGIAVKRGIVVDDTLETDVAGIHAIGECAEHRGVCYGLVEPAHEQARVLATRLSGRDARYAGSVLSTNLKVSGVNVFSVGDFLGAEGTEQIVLSDPGIGLYKKLVIADGRLVGAVLFGDTADGLWYFDLIRSGADIETMRDDLAFGRALAEHTQPAPTLLAA